MTQARLAALLEKPEVHRLILGAYRGAYSVGVTRHPDDRGVVAIAVRVQGAEDDVDIPASVDLEGEEVAVVVRTGFEPPRPL